MFDKAIIESLIFFPLSLLQGSWRVQGLLFYFNRMVERRVETGNLRSHLQPIFNCFIGHNNLLPSSNVFLRVFVENQRLVWFSGGLSAGFPLKIAICVYHGSTALIF